MGGKQIYYFPRRNTVVVCRHLEPSTGERTILDVLETIHFIYRVQDASMSNY